MVRPAATTHPDHCRAGPGVREERPSAKRCGGRNYAVIGTHRGNLIRTRDYLVQSGVDPKIIDAKGYGQSDPLENGESAQARAKNRRVEISIVDSVLHMEGVVPPTTTASPQ